MAGWDKWQIEGHLMRMGVDLGGTKIEALVLGDDDRILVRHRVSTPQGRYEATLAAIAHLVGTLESEIGNHCSIGIGIPGSLSPVNGRVRNANSTCLNGHPLREDLEQYLDRQIRIENDANCFTLSEALDGSAQGARSVFGVILGTGVGGGLVVSNHLLLGKNAIAGEWGHNPLPWPQDDERPGPACYCGKRGCIETFLSGPALVRDHLRHVQAAPHSHPDLTAECLWAAAQQGDNDALVSITRYQDRLARALACVINIVDPEVIVLGGGLSNQRQLYENLPGLLRAYVFSDHLKATVVPPAHGDSSGVLGAARLWPPADSRPVPGR